MVELIKEVGSAALLEVLAFAFFVCFYLHDKKKPDIVTVINYSNHIVIGSTIERLCIAI